MLVLTMCHPLLQTSSTAGPSLLLESVEQFSANVGQFVAASAQQKEMTVNVPNVGKYYQLVL